MRFIDEFKLLQDKTPRIALVASDSENSDYTNYAYKNKNCYLVFGGHYNEDVLYSQYPYKDRDCTDCDKVEESELSYECTFSANLYNCDYLYNCFSCSDSAFGFDLMNCRNTFLCAGLRTKEYHILNRPMPKEQYQEEVKRLKKAYSARELLQKLEEIRLTVPNIAVIQKNCENCQGSFLKNCKNCYCCFTVINAEDCFYSMYANGIKDSMDCTNIGYDPSELLYQCIGNSGNFNCNFCNACWHNSNLEYCELVFNSHDCFGCISRSHATYEILNKKYEKGEYFKRVVEIKDELKREGLYGKWIYESTYPYEDTIAPLYFS